MMVRTVDLDVVSEVAAPAGSTPLHIACMKGSVAILQAMLQVNYYLHVMECLKTCMQLTHVTFRCLAKLHVSVPRYS